MTLEYTIKFEDIKDGEFVADTASPLEKLRDQSWVVVGNNAHLSFDAETRFDVLTFSGHQYTKEMADRRIIFKKWLEETAGFTQEQVQDIAKHYNQEMSSASYRFLFDGLSELDEELFLQENENNSKSNFFIQDGKIYFKSSLSNIKLARISGLDMQQKKVEIPGEVEVIFELSDKGFKLNEISTSTQLLADIISYKQEPSQKALDELLNPKPRKEVSDKLLNPKPRKKASHKPLNQVPLKNKILKTIGIVFAIGVTSMLVTAVVGGVIAATGGSAIPAIVTVLPALGFLTKMSVMGASFSFAAIATGVGFITAATLAAAVKKTVSFLRQAIANCRKPRNEPVPDAPNETFAGTTRQITAGLGKKKPTGASDNNEVAQKKERHKAVLSQVDTKPIQNQPKSMLGAAKPANSHNQEPNYNKVPRSRCCF